MLVPTKDGSNTIFSIKYNQHYHNINDGAISEALYKHIIPALSFCKTRDKIDILDICFGLGYNTFATILYILKNKLSKKVRIFSPELDDELIKNLKNFEYPKEFIPILPIIKEIVTHRYYKDEQFEICLYIVDATKFIKEQINIDIVYQDAFSSSVNVELWSVDYFKNLYNCCNKDAIITTYSIATPVRLSMYEAGFYIYEYIANGKKTTMAFKNLQKKIGSFVDMELKKERNPNARAIYI